MAKASPPPRPRPARSRRSPRPDAMSASEELQSAYEEWRRLARVEGDAIQQSNWTAVADCQNAMQRLQSRIIRYSDQARQERARLGAEGVAKEKSLQALVTELIEIERRNNTL